MRKSMVTLTVFAICVIISGTASAAATAQLSDILILPEADTPVRIQPPDSDRAIEISSVRAITPDTRVIADQPVKILCPDLQTVEVLPGEAFTCPPPESDAVLVVELPPTPPWLKKLPPAKGDELASLTTDERERLQRMETALAALSITAEQRLFLRVNLYAALDLYAEALRLFEEFPDPLTDPALLRLRARIVWHGGDLRRAYQYFSDALHLSESLHDAEGRALALHGMALLLDAFGDAETAAAKARDAQQAYSEMGYETSIEQLLQSSSE